MRLHDAYDTVVRLGSSSLDHLGWALSVCIATVLAFYIAVVLGQIRLPRLRAARTRRELAAVALTLAGSQLPAVMVSIVACVAHPEKAGIMLLVAPVYLLLLFLSLKLGRVSYFEPEERLESARQVLERARSQLATLVDRGSRRPIDVLVMTAAVLTLPGWAIDWRSLAGEGTTVPLGLLMYVTFVMLSLVALEFQVLTEEGRVIRFMTRTMQWLLMVGAVLFAFSLVVHAPSAAIVMLAILLVLAASLWWPQDRLRNWTLRGAAQEWAAQSFERARDRAAEQIAEIEATDLPL